MVYWGVCVYGGGLVLLRTVGFIGVGVGVGGGVGLAAHRPEA